MFENSEINYPFLRHIRVTFSGLAGANSDKVFDSTGKQDNLHIAVRIEKNCQAPTQDSSVQLFNLAPETRQSFQRSITKVRIEAGWEKGPFPGMTSVFYGQLIASNSSRQGTDIVTVLQVQSMREVCTTTFINKTWCAGTHVKSIVLEIARQLTGVTVCESRVVGFEQKFIGFGGYTLSSDAEQALSRLAEEFGFSWTIIDGRFQAVMDNKSLGNCGTIKDPYLIIVNPTLAGVDREFKGVSGQSIFSPNMTPGHDLNINSSFDPSCNGNFKLNTVVHNLDCFSPNSFITEFVGFVW